MKRTAPFMLVLALLAGACSSATPVAEDAAGATEAVAEAEPDAAPDAQPVPVADIETVGVTNLDMPTAITVTPEGRAYIGERAGGIKVVHNLGQAEAQQVASVEAHAVGDHGVGTVLYHDGHVYVTYTRTPENMPADAPDVPCDPDDFGEDPETSTGCPLYGQVSRFAVNDDGTLGEEESVLGGVDMWCAQFPSHALDDIAVGPDGLLYISAGEGATAWNTDYGQFGDDPCGGDGAMRSQSAEDPGGSITRYDPATGTTEIIAVGLRNPFRIAFAPDSTDLYIADVGWDQWEEINVFDVEAGMANFGWPCREGAAPQERWSTLPQCEGFAPDNLVAPVFAYEQTEEHPAAVTALEVHDGRVYFGDFLLRTLWSMEPDGTDVRVEAQDLAVIDVLSTEAGLLVTDITGGTVRLLSDLPADGEAPAQAEGAEAADAAAG